MPSERRVCVPTVQFLIPLNGVWATLAEHQATASLLLDHYTSPATDPEEVCAAAICVHADGKPWNSTETSEGFLHAATWLEAVTQLLGGALSAPIWAWEECDTLATRRDDRIILEERTHHIAFRLPPVCFPLTEFARELHEATRPAAEMETELIRLASRRYPVEWAELTAVDEASKSGQPLPARTPLDPTLLESDQRLLTATGREFWRLIKNIEREEKKCQQADPEGYAREQRDRHLRSVLQSVHGGELSAAWNKLNAALSAHK